MVVRSKARIMEETIPHLCIDVAGTDLFGAGTGKCIIC